MGGIRFCFGKEKGHKMELLLYILLYIVYFDIWNINCGWNDGINITVVHMEGMKSSHSNVQKHMYTHVCARTHTQTVTNKDFPKASSYDWVFFNGKKSCICLSFKFFKMVQWLSFKLLLYLNFPPVNDFFLSQLVFFKIYYRNFSNLGIKYKDKFP